MREEDLQIGRHVRFKNWPPEVYGTIVGCYEGRLWLKVPGRFHPQFEPNDAKAWHFQETFSFRELSNLIEVQLQIIPK